MYLKFVSLGNRDPLKTSSPSVYVYANINGHRSYVGGIDSIQNERVSKEGVRNTFAAK